MADGSHPSEPKKASMPAWIGILVEPDNFAEEHTYKKAKSNSLIQVELELKSPIC